LVQALGDQLVGPLAIDRRLLGRHGGHDRKAGVVAVDPGAARAACVLQPGQPSSNEPLAPGRHALLVDADLPGDLPVGNPVSGQQDDACPAQGTLGGGVCPQAPFQLRALLGGDLQRRHPRHSRPPRRPIRPKVNHIGVINAEAH